MPYDGWPTRGDRRMPAPDPFPNTHHCLRAPARLRIDVEQASHAAFVGAVLDGERYPVKAGDFVWTSVGGTHGFFNTGDVPVRWLETQSPQPPAQQAFRFNAHWHYLANKLR